MCVCVCVCVCGGVCVCACMHCMHACMRACMHSLYVCMHGCIHTCTHTHTHRRRRQCSARMHRPAATPSMLLLHSPACARTDRVPVPHRRGLDIQICREREGERERECRSRVYRTGINLHNWPHIARVPTLNRSTAQACSGRPRVYSPHTGRSRTGRARDGSRAAPRGRGSGSGVWQHVCVGQAPAYVDACVRRACRGV